jgi:hypothetical protein
MSEHARAERLPRGFVEVFAPLLPGTSDVQVRRLWEVATARVTETLQVRAPQPANRDYGFSVECGGEQQSVATPQAARGRTRALCRHFKIQSCCYLGSASAFQTQPLNPLRRAL